MKVYKKILLIFLLSLLLIPGELTSQQRRVMNLPNREDVAQVAKWVKCNLGLFEREIKQYEDQRELYLDYKRRGLNYPPKEEVPPELLEKF